MPVHQKPTTTFNQLSVSEISTALEAYTINQWSVLAKVSQGNKTIDSSANLGTARKVFIEIDQKQYMLKEIPWYCSDVQLVTNVSLLQECLYHRHIPVPKIVRTANGKNFTEVTHDGRADIFQLQSLIVGEAWTSSEQEICSIARMLAQLHEAAEEIFKKKNNSIKLPQENVFDIATNMLSFAVDEIRQKNPAATAQQFLNLRNIFDSFALRVGDAKRSAESHDYFKVSAPVHGDFNQTNILFGQSKQVVAVLDFDNSCLDNPVHDVAQAILHVSCFEFSGHSSKFANPPSYFDTLKASTFLDSYLSCYAGDKIVLLKNLHDAGVAVSIELSTLGLISGAYDLGSLTQVAEVPRLVSDGFKGLMDRYIKSPSFKEPSP